MNNEQPNCSSSVWKEVNQQNILSDECRIKQIHKGFMLCCVIYCYTLLHNLFRFWIDVNWYLNVPESYQRTSDTKSLTKPILINCQPSIK